MITSINEFRKIFEFSHIHSKLFHGVSSEETAQHILKDGYLKPGNSTNKRGSKLTPKLGMVYMTPDISYAAIYAIGANILGSEIWKETLKNGQFGYIFAINTEAILNNNFYVDEDFIGEALHHIIVNDYSYGTGLKIKDFKYKKELLNLATSILTPLQYQKVKLYNDFADFAVAGKKLMSNIPKYIHENLIELGAACAIEGNITYTEVWKIDKNECINLKKDGSNFFDYATKIEL